MNVFARYTRRSLRRSPTRTLVTVVGIILSVALFTAVIEGAYSGLQYMIGMEAETVGPFHGFFRDLTPAEAAEVQREDGLTAAATWRDAGWALPEGQTEYWFFADVSENFTDLVSVRMLEGRMPVTPREIAVPQSASLTDPENALKVGNTVTVTVGRRTGADGELLGEGTPYFPEEAPETLTEAEERTYTVVGVYENFSYEVEQGLWNIFLTRGGGTGLCRVFFSLDRPERYEEFAARRRELESASARIISHSQLLRFYGVMGGEVRNVLYGLAGVLVFLIAFGSTALIYNAFSISVKERTRQFGLLRSVGATKKELRSTVLYEALVLSAVGIPAGLIVGCGGIGVTLWALGDMFNTLFAGGDPFVRTRMRLALDPGALALSALAALFTVLLSAWVPARRAARLPVMEAIRQTEDVKISPREARVSPLAGKLFGFPGLMAAKSFKRDRKGARATVFALFLSVVLFISATSLCAYLNSTVEILSWENSRADLVLAGNIQGSPEAEDPEETLALLSRCPELTAGAFYLSSGGDASWFDAGDMTAELRQFQREANAFVDSGDGRLYMFCRSAFLDDDLFRELCRINGVDPAPYFDPAAPQALFYNRMGLIRTSDRGRRWESYRVLDPAAFPTEAWEYLGDGRFRAAYRLGAPVDKQVFPFYQAEPMILYPHALRDAVLGPEGLEGSRYEYAFAAPDHTAGLAALTRAAEAAGLHPELIMDMAVSNRQEEIIATVVNVFAGGFIALITLIALANVFNTVSTGVNLRRREFAMLRSLGLSPRGLRRMLGWECAAYGLRALAWGIPAAWGLTWVMYKITLQILTVDFYIPWYTVAAGAAGVFLMMFAAMGAAARGLRKGELAEELRTETF